MTSARTSPHHSTDHPTDHPTDRSAGPAAGRPAADPAATGPTSGTGVLDGLIAANRRYAARYHDPGVPVQPALRVAVVACMDARLDMHGILGLELGDAHVMRNAGGVVTDDMIRSLAISQRRLGTRSVVLIHHTDCGMLQITEDGFRRELEEECGLRPAWAVEAFHNLEEDLRQSLRRVRSSPFLPYTDDVRAYLYDVHTGLLTEVG